MWRHSVANHAVCLYSRQEPVKKTLGSFHVEGTHVPWVSWWYHVCHAICGYNVHTKILYGEMFVTWLCAQELTNRQHRGRLVSAILRYSGQTGGFGTLFDDMKETTDVLASSIAHQLSHCCVFLFWLPRACIGWCALIHLFAASTQVPHHLAFAVWKHVGNVRSLWSQLVKEFTPTRAFGYHYASDHAWVQIVVP